MRDYRQTNGGGRRTQAVIDKWQGAYNMVTKVMREQGLDTVEACKAMNIQKIQLMDQLNPQQKQHLRNIEEENRVKEYSTVE